MTAAKLQALIGKDTKLILFNQIDSTNSFAMSRRLDGLTLIIADSQTGGKGRLGRSFVSPSGGLYMSIANYEKAGFTAGELTAAAAVAVVRAVKKVFGVFASIKWVNDIYLHGKKICGILCESSCSADGTEFKTVVGIGVNLKDNPDFPPQAGAIGQRHGKGIRRRLAAEIFNAYRDLRSDGGFFEEYRDNCFVLGRRVEARYDGKTVFTGTATGLEPDCSLVVQTGEGERVLKFGEISILPL